jgi:hypothetical protein
LATNGYYVLVAVPLPIENDKGRTEHWINGPVVLSSSTIVHKPLGLLAELTHRCPLGCPYCSNPLAFDAREDELDTATWGRVFREAAGLGVLQVHLSGGEPGARRADHVGGQLRVQDRRRSRAAERRPLEDVARPLTFIKMTPWDVLRYHVNSLSRHEVSARSKQDDHLQCNPSHTLYRTARL